jgi:hypothetical protein
MRIGRSSLARSAATARKAAAMASSKPSPSGRSAAATLDDLKAAAETFLGRGIGEHDAPLLVEPEDTAGTFRLMEDPARQEAR